MSFKARTRRTKNYWEPIYEPKLTEEFEVADWEKVKSEGATQKTLTADSLKDYSEKRNTLKFEGIKFIKCDFLGFFNSIKRAIIFNGCDFEHCDFGLTTWERAKFSGCKFQDTSLTQSTWIESEFRDCSWQSIGLSGNETRLIRTYFSNPSELVDAAYLQNDATILSKFKKTIGEQRVRLSETKSVISRQLYNEHKLVGDEDSFYEACKVFLISSSKHRLEKELRPGKLRDGTTPRRRWLALAGLWGELALLRILAWVNKWGASVFRPFALLIASFLLFSFIYWLFGASALESLTRSFDISMLVGYSKQVNGISNWRIPFEYLQVTISLILYTMFFSTIVAKICRVR